MEDIKEKVFDFVKFNGPIIPVQVSKQFNTNILFASAILGQLVSEKRVMYSNVKIGGTPVYYITGQERKLEALGKYLGEKPKMAFELLREKNVLKDRDCEPWQRVALREIKDFAYSFQFENELYWRWYLMNEEEALRLVMPKKVIAEKTVKFERKEVVKEKPEKKPKEEQRQKKLDAIGDEFYDNIVKYFNKNDIRVKDDFVIKKGKEVDFIVEVGSKLGNLKYFVKAMNKKKISESDLSLAYNQGRQNNLPVLFLTNGELTKKSANYLEKNLSGYVILNKI